MLGGCFDAGVDMFIDEDEGLARLEASLDGVLASLEAPPDDVGDLISESKPLRTVKNSKEARDLANPLDNLKHLNDFIDPLLASQKPSYKLKPDAQTAIGETAIMIGEQNAANMFGQNSTQAHAYSHGMRSNGPIAYNKGIPEVQERLKTFKAALAIKASERLASALDMLDDTKLRRVKRATDISRIAKDMAVIVDKVTEKVERHGNEVHFHVYRPEAESVSAYEVISVGSGSSSGALESVKPEASE